MDNGACPQSKRPRAEILDPRGCKVVTRTLAILAGQARAHPPHQRARMQRVDGAGLPGAEVTGSAANEVKEGIAVR